MKSSCVFVCEELHPCVCAGSLTSVCACVSMCVCGVCEDTQKEEDIEHEKVSVTLRDAAAPEVMTPKPESPFSALRETTFS